MDSPVTGHIVQGTEDMRAQIEAQASVKGQPSFFHLRAQLPRQVRTDTPMAATDRMWVVLKTYASDGENFTEDRTAASEALNKLSSLLNYIGYVETVPGSPRSTETEMKMMAGELERNGASVGTCVLSRPDDVWKAIRKFFMQQTEQGEVA